MNLNDYAKRCHDANNKWWVDLDTGLPKERNKGELIALMHSELSEALEGERKDLMDDHLEHRKMAEVEMADVIIRVLDYCHAYGYDIDGAFEDKMAYNATRHDHSAAARKADHGKKF